jgi:hypothetical protein
MYVLQSLDLIPGFLNFRRDAKRRVVLCVTQYTLITEREKENIRLKELNAKYKIIVGIII